MSLLALLHKLATWGDQDRSKLICIPKYFTNETVARGVLSTIKHGGSLMFFFLEMSMEQHFAGYRESSELLIQATIASMSPCRIQWFSKILQRTSKSGSNALANQNAALDRSQTRNVRMLEHEFESRFEICILIGQHITSAF